MTSVYESGLSLHLLAQGLIKHLFHCERSAVGSGRREHRWIQAIVGYADLGLRDLPRASPLRNDLAEIEKATTRASSLTRQLLAFLRKQPIEACELDLNVLILDTTQTMEQSLGAAFLQKPFTLAALARKVRHVLDKCSGTAAKER